MKFLIKLRGELTYSLGLFGPFTSVSQQYLAAAVAFDIDFRKHFDPDLAAAFGSPVVSALCTPLEPPMPQTLRNGKCNGCHNGRSSHGNRSTNIPQSSIRFGVRGSKGFTRRQVSTIFANLLEARRVLLGIQCEITFQHKLKQEVLRE
eukprot:2826405-Amphidinium_carterae.1